MATAKFDKAFVQDAAQRLYNSCDKVIKDYESIKKADFETSVREAMGRRWFFKPRTREQALEYVRNQHKTFEQELNEYEEKPWWEIDRRDFATSVIRLCENALHSVILTEQEARKLFPAT